METAWHNIVDWVHTQRWEAITWALVILVLGWFIARLGGKLAELTMRAGGAQRQMIAERLIRYALTLVTLALALYQLGVGPSVFVGAAGIMTVAVGFASQTSASNLISGFFLMGEQPFVVGDVVQIDDTVGEVMAITLLSVRLRTFDNLMVRIPNETLLKAKLKNLTHFPIRRLDVHLRVAYSSHISAVREVLERVADKNPLCLVDPKPLFIFQGFGESALDLQFSVWAARENYIALRNAIYEEIKDAFDEAGVEIPYPKRSVHLVSDER